MRIQILCSAMEDLPVGRKLYDRQETGIGDYFFDYLFSEIDSLTIYGGIHSIHFGFIVCWQSVSLTPFITELLITEPSFFAFLIADAIQDRFVPF